MKVLSLIIGLFISLQAFCEESHGEIHTNGNESQFTIEKNLVDKLFNQSLAGSPRPSDSVASVDLGFGQFYPKQMNIKNNYFSIPYQDNLRALSLLSLSLSKRIGASAISTIFKTGYSYSQGVYEVHSDAGSNLSDTLSMQWVPVQVGLSCEVFSLSVARFHFHGGVGGDYLSQTGSLDGLSQSFFVPHAFGGARISLFDGPSDNGFEGVQLTMQTQKSFDQDQKIQGWMVGLARFAL